MSGTVSNRRHKAMDRNMQCCLLILAMVLGLHSTCGAAQVTPGTLCQEDEQVVFSCPVKDGSKIVSLCGAKHLTAQDGYLQYRFGRAGRVELEFPAQRQNTQSLFRYAHYFRYQVERLAVSFDTQGYTYTLFDAYEGDTGTKTHQQGVQITPPGTPSKVITFLCRGPALGMLHSLRTIVPCDKTDALNLGACQ
jgi:hypothetical protein